MKFFRLGERNLSLWNNLHSFIQSTVANTSKRLIDCDQLLVQSQVTLQTASKTIKKANETTAELTDKFKAIVNGNFIPPINFRWSWIQFINKLAESNISKINVIYIDIHLKLYNILKKRSTPCLLSTKMQKRFQNWSSAIDEKVTFISPDKQKS